MIFLNGLYFGYYWEHGMRKLIKSTDDIPKIFDIDRYVGMDKLSAFDWLFLLLSRWLIQQDILENGLSGGFVIRGSLNEIEEQEAIQHIIKQFFENPLSLDLSINYLKQDKHNIFIQISNTKNYSFVNNNLPVSELYENQFDMIGRLIKDSGEKLRVLGSNKPFRPVADIVNAGMDFDYFLTDYPITINPFYPDNIIIDELKKVLINIRNKIGFDKKNKPILQRDLINWASYKLLPYFDLKLLEVYEGIKISNSVICSILYPKGEYGEDNLRKSVEPIRQKILNQIGFDSADGITEISIFDSLCYLAYNELHNKGKKIDEKIP